MEIKFVVTTRIEILQSLKAQGYYLVGIDGTVLQSKDIYEELYDHHRLGGSEVQMDEIADISPYRPAKKIAITTTMVDADAIVASYLYITLILGNLVVRNSDNYKLLRAISFDCDHLAVPQELSEYAKDAAMIVAALKEVSNDLVQKLGLPTNRREWSVEDKELFSSKAFELGVAVIIPSLLNGTWDYSSVAKSYWIQVEKNTKMIISEGRISCQNGVAIFDGRGITSYIDPRCWYRALYFLKLDTYTGLAVTQREVFVNNVRQGYSYTVRKIPFSNFDGDFNSGLFKALNWAESRKTNIHDFKDGWGGRATVGGSGFNTPSNLSVEEIVEVINNWLDKK